MFGANKLVILELITSQSHFRHEEAEVQRESQREVQRESPLQGPYATFRKLKSGHQNIMWTHRETDGQHKRGWRLNRNMRAVTGPCGFRNMETLLSTTFPT